MQEQVMTSVPAEADPERRIASFDWLAVHEELDARGYAVLPGFLSADACAALEGLYDHEEAFRSRVVMARHAYGEGEYKYFDYPLPDLVSGLREAIYPRLVGLANTWSERLRRGERYPANLETFLTLCRAAGQHRATPLLLRYGPGGYNCLHQDLYGATAFPFQVAALLSAPGRDFTGGEFLLVEQRPRRQSKAEVVPLGQGDGVVFAGSVRPVASARGFSQAKLRHGVSRILTGHRATLGIIFHDAL